MAKKAEKLSKEYLEEKLKNLSEQEDKVERILEQYSELWQKLAGAVEVVQDMLNELKDEESTDTDSSTK